MKNTKDYIVRSKRKMRFDGKTGLVNQNHHINSYNP